MGNSSKSNFHQPDFELWDSFDFPNFPPLYPINCQKSCIFCSFCKVFTLYSSRKIVWKINVIQTSTAPHNYVQVSCAPKRLFRGFVLFWRTKWVPLSSAINKNSQFLNDILSTSSISNTMQDILLQKSTELKIEERKSSTWKKEWLSDVTEQTWIWSSPNHVTVAWTVATSCPRCSSSIM